MAGVSLESDEAVWSDVLLERCSVGRLGSSVGVPEGADVPGVGVAASPEPGVAERAEKWGRSSSSSRPLMTPSVLEGFRVETLGGAGGTN